MSAQWTNSRSLVERIIVTGTLVLETPTHFGNGDSEGLLDMPLHLDALEGKALLTGSSLAGGLRGYLHTIDPILTKKLFGKAEGQQSDESLIIIDDAIGEPPQVELRDGVAIDPKTRTAEDKKKYDIQLLAAGTTFPVSFELLIRKDDNAQELLGHFALGLQALAQGEIRLGKRKRRGFGRCSVASWAVQRFAMTTAQGMLNWLRFDPLQKQASTAEGQNIFQLLGTTAQALPKPIFALDATFALDGSLLIRSLPDNSKSADVVHLTSKRKGSKEQKSVLSGTSLAGALRARALRIVNTVALDNGNTGIVDNIFGYRSKCEKDNNPLWASRLWVDETVIEQPLRLVQSRVKIDRFTGGSYPGALFSEEAAFGAKETKIKVQLRLGEATNPRTHENPDGSNDYAEIGLLLLLLKDLWTGDLPLGGESSVGRGRLKGECATITIEKQSWTLCAGEKGELVISQDAITALEDYVKKFVQAMNGESVKQEVVK